MFLWTAITKYIIKTSGPQMCLRIMKKINEQYLLIGFIHFHVAHLSKVSERIQDSASTYRSSKAGLWRPERHLTKFEKLILSLLKERFAFWIKLSNERSLHFPQPLRMSTAGSHLNPTLGLILPGDSCAVFYFTRN